MITIPNISKWKIFNVDKANLNDYYNLHKYFNIFELVKQQQYINSNYNDIYIEKYSLTLPKGVKDDQILDYFIEIGAYSLNGLFSGCSTLEYLPDISNWEITNVKNINNMFEGCTSLIELPDISKWNTINIIYMNKLFKNCSSLQYLPDISKWNLENALEINCLFS